MTERSAGATRRRPGAHRIVLGDNLEVLRGLRAGSVDLIYIDPPFNTGRRRRQTRLRTVQSADGDRTGFQGRSYRTIPLGTRSFLDVHDDYLEHLRSRLLEARRVLARHGSIYFHIDYREVHYCKVLLDAVFGRECFLNEIIWAYDYGARSKRRWPPKHDNILLYARDAAAYHFDLSEVDRIPYMAPGLVTPEKAARGKTPTDTWWQTIVPTAGRERTGYPTQKPVGIVERAIRASSRPGALVLDFYAGSGTTGAACLRAGRRFLLVDDNPEACAVMAERFRGVGGIEWVGYRSRANPAAAGGRARARGGASATAAGRTLRAARAAPGR
jgi:site-specific DNA-methyltransferase (adenine-specific)